MHHSTSLKIPTQFDHLDDYLSGRRQRLPSDVYPTFVRDHHKEQSKGVIQLDLFKPHDFNYRYKVIVTNKTTQARQVVEYHEGRGSQEGLFAELKTEAAMSYVPCNGWNANKLYLLSNVIAHN